MANGSIVAESVLDSKPGMNFLKHKVMSSFSLSPSITVALISSKGLYLNPMEESSSAKKEGVGSSIVLYCTVQQYSQQFFKQQNNQVNHIRS